MSRTEVFGVPKKGGELIFLGECTNAWRGAMWIWTKLAEKYFPGREPYSVIMKESSGFWKLIDDPRLSDTDWYAFATTLDAVVVPNELIGVVADALENFSPGTENLKMQADLLRKAKKDGLRGVCWNQTSVNGDPWHWWTPGEDDHRYVNVDTDETWYPGGRKIWFLTSREDFVDNEEDESGA